MLQYSGPIYCDASRRQLCQNTGIAKGQRLQLFKKWTPYILLEDIIQEQKIRLPWFGNTLILDRLDVGYCDLA